MTRKKIVGLALALSALTVTAWAEGQRKLEHYPSDISPERLKSEMKMMKTSLGTRCVHCHQAEPRRDFAAETKKKKLAVHMLQMTAKLNENGSAYFAGERPQRITCYMCHKGEEEVPTEPAKPEDEARFKQTVDSGRKKRTVDAMKRLVDDLNEKYFTWKDAPKATCWMCHRGRGEFRARLPRVEDDEEDKSVDWGLPSKPDEKKPAPAKSAPGKDAPLGPY